MHWLLLHALPFKGTLILSWLILLLVAETIRPKAPIPLPLAGYARPWWRRWARNFSLAALNGLAGRFFILPLTFWASDHALGHWWPESAWGIIGALVGLDCAIYWWHRANHRWPFLWRFHQVHHRDEFLDTSTALRFHVGEVVLSALARAGVILFLGVPLAAILLFDILVTLAALFHHSNLRLAPTLEATLSRVIITPSLHWVHHHRRRSDTDANYGTVFSFWDLLFGSRAQGVRTPLMSIGMPGGIELSLPELLAQPLR
ncbi:MAG TPA: sterol desaturase family protein [Dongiaceae bacterium]|jgi:sterol desaturase/sphingolipid hydroxylase (fatty acid hydroxylase superfamily)|nr:sterol desaturase family protein [Dongiaceae bacterium]